MQPVLTVYNGDSVSMDEGGGGAGGLLWGLGMA